MLDNLRESASQSPFFQDQPDPEEEKKASRRRRKDSTHFLGMTPVQRFVIALMLFMMVCVFGSFILLATEKIWL
jgi:hypothetical protein